MTERHDEAREALAQALHRAREDARAHFPFLGPASDIAWEDEPETGKEISRRMAESLISALPAPEVTEEMVERALNAWLRGKSFADEDDAQPVFIRLAPKMRAAITAALQPEGSR